MTATKQSPLRVLIVDDHEDSCELLGVVLEQRGHVVTTAHDGERAIALLQEETFDVAVIDIGLPLADGFEVAREARALGERRSPYLIALTGYGAKDHREAMTKAGFDRQLIKPVDIETFAEAVTKSRATPTPG